MKTRMLICLAIVFVSLQSFAQGKTKGFISIQIYRLVQEWGITLIRKSISRRNSVLGIYGGILTDIIFH